MKQITCLFLLLISASIVIQAEESREITMIVGIGTYHFSNDPAHSNNNEIIGLLSNRWFATRYKNSHKGESWGLGYAIGDFSYLPARNSPITLRGRLWSGVATGYGERLTLHWGPLTLAFIPEVAAEIELSDQWSIGYSGLYIWTETDGVWVNGIQFTYRF